MRIISGSWRGRNFYTPKGVKARPTSDMIREALFNILYAHIDDSVVVDLFAGGGGFGLEALSRGAAEVHFCDIERRSTQAIEFYLHEFGATSKQYRVYNMEYIRAIRKMSSNFIMADIVFIDPPYTKEFYKDAMEAIKEILNPGAIVIVEHNKRTKIKPVDGYQLTSDRRYGNTIISIYSYSQEGS